MTYFKENLKYLRKKYNLSQQEVAECLGIKQRTYGNYEIGHSEPNLEMLSKIADFFITSLDKLVLISLNKEDRAFISEISERTGISNTEIAIECASHLPEFANAIITKKKPNPHSKKMEKIFEVGREIEHKQV